jgi:hypothetical protein
VKLASAICTVLALFAQLGGVALIVGEARRSKRVLREWRSRNPNRNQSGSYDQLRYLNTAIDELFSSKARPAIGVALIVGGAMFGAAANLLGLA